MIRYCTKCLLPETKPDLWFDEDGVCAACLNFDARQEVDWDDRQQELREIVGRYQSISRSTCLWRQRQYVAGPKGDANGTESTLRHRNYLSSVRHRATQHSQHPASGSRSHSVLPKPSCARGIESHRPALRRRHLLARARRDLHHSSTSGRGLRSTADCLGGEFSERVWRSSK